MNTHALKLTNEKKEVFNLLLWLPFTHQNDLISVTPIHPIITINNVEHNFFEPTNYLMLVLILAYVLNKNTCQKFPLTN